MLSADFSRHILIAVKFVIVGMCWILVFTVFCLIQWIQGYLSIIAHPPQITSNKQWTFPSTFFSINLQSLITISAIYDRLFPFYHKRNCCWLWLAGITCFVMYLFDFTLEAQPSIISGSFDCLHHLPSKPVSEKESNRQIKHPSNIKIYCEERGWEEGVRDRKRDLLEHTMPCGKLYNLSKAWYKYFFFLCVCVKENRTSASFLFVPPLHKAKNQCCPL